MSGPLGSQQWMYATEALPFYPYTIDNSLRFDGTSYFYRDMSGGSSTTTTWTMSFWVKRTILGEREFLFSAGDGTTTTYFAIEFTATDNLRVISRWASSAVTVDKISTMVFRDPSAWLHLHLEYDSTLATAEDRVKIFVNGDRITSFSTNTNPPINQVTPVNTANRHVLAESYYGGFFGKPANSYLADFHLVGDVALSPSSFGGLKSGIWVPKAYTGGYGDYGFHLDFANGTSATTLGYDAAGSNNFTPSGIAATDQMLDSPTNNFCVFNDLDKATGHVNSEGNLKTATTIAGYGMTKSTVVMSTARETTSKWYAEFYYQANTDTSNVAFIGVTEAGTDPDSTAYQSATTYGYYAFTGNFFDAGTGDVYGGAYAVGDIVGVSFDESTGELEFFKNNVSQGVAKSGLSGDFVFFVADASGSRSVTIVANFGQDSSFAGNKTAQNNADENGYGDFYYTPPSGHLALCSANLPAPTFNPAVGASPQDHFSVDLDADGSGALTAAQAVFPTGIWWLKDRTLGSDHLLVDSARGSTLELNPNSTAIERTYSDPSNSSVSWSWKAATSISGTTTGSGTLKPYSVRVNAEAGVSVVEYEGNATAGHQIPHHLGTAPSVVIVKNRDYNSGNWMVYHAHIDASPETCSIVLNGSSAKTSSVSIWNSTLPSASVVSLGGGSDENRDTDGHVLYAFAEKDGFSKFGVYPGNYNVDGPFVYLGFRPAFVMIKATGGTSGKWAIFDSARDGYNVDNDALHVYPVGAEDTTDQVDLLSNGFKVRVQIGDLNNSAYEYIYMAFAEQPFKYANAR